MQVPCDAQHTPGNCNVVSGFQTVSIYLQPLSACSAAQQVPDAWAWALGVQVFSWYMQIHPGHGILEKRKPALLDSLVQVRGVVHGVEAMHASYHFALLSSTCLVRKSTCHDQHTMLY